MAAASAIAFGSTASPIFAATYDFAYTTSSVSVGSAIEARGTLTVVPDMPGLETVLSATGLVNGSRITGLDPNGINLLVDPFLGAGTERVGFTTASGTTYDFDFPFATDTSGDFVSGTFFVSQVPLPGSASLFGAAVMVLGLLGAGRRRRAKSAA